MSVSISELTIEELWGYQTFRIPIKDNKLVLVGENGTGKSTVANLFYFFLTRQWEKINDFDFKAIALVINDKKLYISKEKYYSYSSDPFFRRVDRIITEIVKEEIIYLPTYRRIEQEFKEIFPELYEKKSSRRKTQKNYVELVEFGMEDVEQTINEKMNNLKDSIRNRLENLTGTYLSDVISKVYKQVNVEELKDLDNETVESIFSRIDEKIISAKEKEELRNMLEKVNNEGKIEEDQKVIAHFLLKLLKWHKEQQEQEQEIRNFVNICNEYLVNKEIIYDNIKLRIDIISNLQKIHSDKNNQESDNQKIELKMLSSGEKQIVSLFSHLYLSDKSDYFVIIDEPELSLSVPWQKRFLPDILNSGRCNGLIAVTHSPFIFDNELDSYAHSLSEFIDN